MNIWIHVFVILFAIIISLCIVKDVNFFTSEEKEETLLAVGILSAQDNFAQRETIRKTWLKEHLPYKTCGNHIKAWFIVGKKFCEIPPEYRLNQYGCEKWEIDLSKVEKYFVTSKEAISYKESSTISSQIYNQGFSFQVQYPVVITKLGILSKLLLKNEIARIALLDLQSKEILVQATIIPNNSYVYHGYTYAKVEQFLLPKGYQGLILTEGYLRHEANATMKWNNGGGVVTIDRVYSSPSHLESVSYSPDCFVAASIGFFIQDIKGLEDIVNKEELSKRQWTNLLKDEEAKIKKESEEQKDILLVDMVDVYRNLPVKLLEFLKWLTFNQNFNFVMKIDDDSIPDLDRLKSRLKNTLLFNPSKHWIWSRFRRDWPLNHIGKWADYEYRSSLYPMFPCGSGYVLSRETASWLSLNSQYLYPYQGEDVSMGIWLSAINPPFIEDENWNCDAQCNTNSYNAAQLTVGEMYEAWSRYQECGNLCACEATTH